MELQAGTLVDEPLELNSCGVVAHRGEGTGGGQMDDLDMNFLSDLLQPDHSSRVEVLPSSNESEDSSPTADSVSRNTAETSSSADEPVLSGPGRAKRAKKAVSSSSFSASTELVQAEPEPEQEKRIVDRKARRRAQVASSARRLRCRKKVRWLLWWHYAVDLISFYTQYEMMTLKTEANFLEQQLESLRSKHKQMRANNEVAAWEERAIAQRHKRRQAEMTNEKLRQALILQSGFVRNLRSMFSQAMPYSIELNMRNFLHTPTRLLKDQHSRVRNLERVCTDAKLAMAKQIILEETGGIKAFTSPHIACQQIDLGRDGFGMTTVAVYALETRNACKTFKATCSAVMNCAAVWPNYTLVTSSLKAVDLPPTELNIRYGMSHNIYESDATGDRVSVESREISYYRMTEDCGVFLWDYVDADDVNPLREDTTAMRYLCHRHPVSKLPLAQRLPRRSTDMAYLGDGLNASGSMDEEDFDMNLLSEILFQADGMPSLTEESHGTQMKVGMGSTDDTSSSDDAGASLVSPSSSGSSSATRDRAMDRKAKRRAQVAVSARRHRYRKKHEMLELKQEVADLFEKLHALRSKHKLLRPDGAVAEAEEYTMAQRYKRRQAEKMNEQLRRALVMQRRFFASMQNIVVNSPITSAELNMSSLLHTFTHLGRTAYSRRRDYLALCTDLKADLAMQILLRETEGMDFTGPPSILTHSVPAMKEQQQIVTTVAAYAFDFLDLKTVFVSACDAILGCGTDWPQYTTVSQEGEVLDKPQGNISYAKTATSYQSNTADASQVQDVSVESRALVFYRMSANHGVLVWDFADQDDLHPVKHETAIKRDIVGAAMVRREICHDGVERVVYRSICTKLHSFLLQSKASEVSKYLQNTREGAKVCGHTVLKHIRQHAAQAGMVCV
ncbi:unnamed protein product [Phytophthora lilii]|uniref:Unnamed protein product n=1 Tax=Phytophthora lilii TaxID=2077276 RepID=A0A9W6U4R0_9STRA|nr:unnamed protein product [Phytophthora lilii]